jgi:hypothetical protein
MQHGLRVPKGMMMLVDGGDGFVGSASIGQLGLRAKQRNDFGYRSVIRCG